MTNGETENLLSLPEIQKLTPKEKKHIAKKKADEGGRDWNSADPDNTPTIFVNQKQNLSKLPKHKPATGQNKN